ncbi:sensor domain-containing diguanylate cyclase [Novosphingobium pentaromativorans]|uniref:diguanylate cyclase n=1 Tax=Novosphingobium pentaromativorans US6-1 TaxID=1088721 RepID=G6EI34_9SPHN|nr:diguanylate cyclase [Novosphingobium pentaromativorans]EHJ59022.1 two-component system, PleD related family,response regulator [Novosphingobium pentaromativorans US6-1]
MTRSRNFLNAVNGLSSRVGLFIASTVLFGSLLVGSSLIAWRANVQQQELARLNSATIALLRDAHRIRLIALEALRGERGYLLTRDPEYLEPMLEAERALPGYMANLRSHIDGNEENNRELQRLGDEVQSYFMDLRTVLVLDKAGMRKETIDIVRTGHARNSINRINADVHQIITRERARLSEFNARTRSVNNILLMYLFAMTGTGVCLLFTTSLTVIALRRSIARERAFQRELRYIAQTDELTGIANRREFLAALDRAIALARRNQSQFSLAIFDIDHFKSINDTYGHAAGDDVIRRVARLAVGTVRACDLVGRIGGEEFGVLLPNVDMHHARAICERLRVEIQAQAMELSGDATVPVTISSGVAQLDPSENANKLMERADRALYEAKHGGRDQVRLAA